MLILKSIWIAYTLCSGGYLFILSLISSLKNIYVTDYCYLEQDQICRVKCLTIQILKSIIHFQKS